MSCDPAALVTALAAVSGAGQSGTVTLTASCTYSMTMINNTQDGPNAFPDILGNVTVVGNGATITRSHSAPAFRFFMVDDGGALNIRNLTLSNGLIASGGLHGGAAILNRSNLTVTGVTFSGNQSQGSTGGGAIDNHDAGVLSVSGSTFAGNTGLQGGAIEDEATLCHTVEPVCGHATISQSTFTNNSTTQYGGGGFEAQLDGPNPAAICGPTWPQPTCQEAGGAHDTLDGDTFSGNTATTEGGGIASFGTMTVTNSTIYNNSAGTGGGGGVQNTGTLNIVQSTIAGNSAPNGANVHDFADSAHQPGATTLTMTIVSGGAGGGANCSGTNVMTDGGHNIDSGNSCGFAVHALPNTDPKLGSLASNGGPTQTMALQAGSPAIDAIPSSVGGCTGSTDQRGITRPQGSGCEIGAFEVDKTPPSVPTGLSTATTAKPSVVLNWTASTDNVGVAGYDIYRDGSSTALAVVSGSTLTYEDTAVQQTTTYHYTVNAFDGAGNYSAKSASASATTPRVGRSGTPCTGATPSNWFASCSNEPYTLTGSNGSTWQDMDTSTPLSVTFTPSVASYAVLSANTSLFTSKAGYNQDIGIAVSGGAFPTTSGQPEAWKESGGATTLSPNAAYLQAVIPVASGTQYTARLQWKTNIADPYSIWAGAGPIAGQGFAPTRITAMLVPQSAGTVFSVTSTQHYHLTGSDGSTWTDMDATNVSLPFTPPTGSWLAYIGGNADLWTQSAGHNQDLGVAVSGGVYPTNAGQPETWKESGGGGMFAPNAAFAQVPLPVAGGTTYTAKLQWKSNHADPGTIAAGAGPVNGAYSPTSIVVVLLPNPAGGMAVSSTQLYADTGSDGATWKAVDATNLKLTITPGSTANYLLGGNADLVTRTAGYNQDLGIMISGGTFGTGTVVAWEESGGGFAFSPNAAFTEVDVKLASGSTYTVTLVWKSNRAAPGVTLQIGAGPIGSAHSPTWLAGEALP